MDEPQLETSPSPASAADSPEDLRQRTEAVARALVQRLSALHAEVLPPGAGPKRAADELGQPVPMASRVLKALAAPNPLAALQRLPGPAPLRRWVRAAGRRAGDGEAARAAQAAVDAFEALIAAEAGDRSAFDARLVAWLPEARRTVELRRRQAVFRGLSELEGASCALDLSTMLLHPSADGRHVDLCCLQARTGLVALRPGVAHKFVTERLTPGAPARHPSSLEGADLELDGPKVRLDAFCSGAPAELDAVRHGDRSQYTLRAPGLGPHAPADIVLAEVNRGEFLGPDGPPHGAPFFTHLVQLPARAAVLDVVLHPSLGAGVEPELTLYRNLGEAQARPGDPLREVDRIEPLEGAQRLQGELVDQRLPGFPRYGELLAHVCARLGWDLSGARLHRAQLDYPVPGTQLTLTLRGARF